MLRSGWPSRLLGWHSSPLDFPQLLSNTKPGFVAWWLAEFQARSAAWQAPKTLALHASQAVTRASWTARAMWAPQEATKSTMELNVSSCGLSPGPSMMKRL